MAYTTNDNHDKVRYDCWGNDECHKSWTYDDWHCTGCHWKGLGTLDVEHGGKKLKAEAQEVRTKIFFERTAKGLQK
jgi:hypothetical protein